MLSTIGHQVEAPQPSVFQQVGQQMQEEWMGQTSSKFRGHKLHVPQPDYKETKHPLF